jgi:hypothetical protein
MKEVLLNNINGQSRDLPLSETRFTTVNNLLNYSKETVLKTILESFTGWPGAYELDVAILGPNTLETTISININHECQGEIVPAEEYVGLLEKLIEKRSRDVGDVFLIDDPNYDYDYSVKYSNIIECTSLKDAANKILELLKEIMVPLEYAIDKVHDFLLKELNLEI